MGASIWEPGNNITVTNIKKQQFTATAAQVLFTLTLFAYAVGTGSVNVYINGLLQMPTSYTETSSTQITLSEGCSVGDEVLIIAVTL